MSVECLFSVTSLRVNVGRPPCLVLAAPHKLQLLRHEQLGELHPDGHRRLRVPFREKLVRLPHVVADDGAVV